MMRSHLDAGLDDLLAVEPVGADAVEKDGGAGGHRLQGGVLACVAQDDGSVGLIQLNACRSRRKIEGKNLNHLGVTRKITENTRSFFYMIYKVYFYLILQMGISELGTQMVSKIPIRRFNYDLDIKNLKG